jgi:tetratricopeptide (TPR) repeat protein
MKTWVLVLMAGTALADKERARRLFEEGVTRYNLGEYATALARFKSAYEDFPDPSLLYNTAQCHRQLGEKGQAVTLYRSFLREVPGAANADEVRRLIVALDAELLREQVTRQQPPQGVAAPAVETRHERRHPVGWAIGGTGLIVAALGVGLIGGSISTEDNARSAQLLQQQRELHARANALEAGGWVVTGIGAAAVVTAVALLARRGR